jgi:hypothetical protein
LNVVGDQADDHQGRPVQGRQPFGSQDDLVQTVAADAAIQDGAAGQPLQLRGSGVEVADVLAVGEGIADRQYGRIGRRRLQPENLNPFASIVTGPPSRTVPRTPGRGT